MSITRPGSRPAGCKTLGGLRALTITTLAVWSIGVQLATVVLLALFFTVLARAMRLAEVRLWAMAWWADAIAIGAVFGSALSQAAGSPPERLSFVVYAAGKTAFGFLLVAGARSHLKPGRDLPLQPLKLTLLIAIWSLCLGGFAPRMSLVQLGQSLMVGGLMTAGAWWVLRNPRYGRSRWLGWAFLGQGLLFLHYVPVLAPSIWGGGTLFRYGQFSSFIDAGIELVVALSCLVAVESSTSEHLRHLNQELVASQERLRQLVDLDPLTNLINRRGLRQHLARVQDTGASLIFLDLNDFKEINDRHGHIAGDLCLRRVATQLMRTFRAEDAVFRWGGDEFLVISQGLDVAAAEARVEELRKALREAADEGPSCTIAVGVVRLEPGAALEDALEQADQLMYEDKLRRSRSSSGVSRLSGIWTRG